MTTSDYENMVSMLIRVTDNRLLDWTEDEKGFTASVGNCSIRLSTYYDTSVNINEYVLSLFNTKGEKFESFSYDESDNEYSKLDTLYHSIRDSIYHITESEKNILDSLEDMSKKIPEDSELSF